ncbi:MAG: NINE protein [Desulfosalsimonas sp.]
MNNEQQGRKAEEKYCTSCGEIIRANAEICPKCGVRQPKRVSKVALVLITFFLGGIGAHKFYTKQYLLGFLYFLFFWTGIPGLIALIEFIIYLFTSEERLQEKYTATGAGGVILILACLVAVIMFLGILAAIAIPNFVAYKNLAQCSVVESDMSKVRVAISSYYADPSHEETPTLDELKESHELNLKSQNIKISGKFPDICISIADSTGRCPKGDKYVRCLDDDTGEWR